MPAPIPTVILALTDLKRLTWRAGLAIALIVIAYVIPRLVGVSEGVTDILDQGNMIGLALLLAEIARARQEEPPPPPSPNERGHMAAPLLYALGIIAVCACAWAWAGCATVERNGETLGFQLRRDPARVGPACLYRLTIDGELVHSGRIDECPAVPVCEVPQ